MVLPPQDPRTAPGWAPRRRDSAGLGHYLLSPFAYPCDLRLRDGRAYRIVWIDAHGQPMPPRADTAPPGFRFFVALGPPHASVETTVRAPSIAPSESAAPAQHPSQPPSDAPPPPPPPQPSVQAEEIRHTPLTPDEQNQLWPLLYSEELAECVRYEVMIRSTAPGSGPKPPEPQGLIGANQRKAARRIAHDPRLLWHWMRLHTELRDACMRDLNAVFRLPPPFRSLSSDDQKRLSAVLQDGARMSFIVHCIRQQNARQAGAPPPAPVATTLSPQAQHELRRLITDVRKQSYLFAAAMQMQSGK